MLEVWIPRNQNASNGKAVADCTAGLSEWVAHTPQSRILCHINSPPDEYKGRAPVLPDLLVPNAISLAQARLLRLAARVSALYVGDQADVHVRLVPADQSQFLSMKLSLSLA